MPGFGFLGPSPSYEHSLDHGAQAVLGVLDSTEVNKRYPGVQLRERLLGLRIAQLAPERVSSLVLSQTPSMSAMQIWAKRAIPWPLGVPVLGQIVGWLIRKRAAHVWYGAGLPRTTSAKAFEDKAQMLYLAESPFAWPVFFRGSLEKASTPCRVGRRHAPRSGGATDHSHE